MSLDWSFATRVPDKGGADRNTTPPASPATPARIDAFVVLGTLGKGAMGTVFLARREGHPPVALKLLTGMRTERDRERFRREGHIAASLRHEGIVTVHMGGIHNGTPYLVYELVEGARTLREGGTKPTAPTGCGSCFRSLRRSPSPTARA